MIQIDIDMPTDCASCWIRQNMGCKIANKSGWLNNRRDDNCPLKEQEPLEPKIVEKECAGPTNYYCFCQRCGNYLGSIVKKKGNANLRKKFCDNCGQAVKWE